MPKTVEAIYEDGVFKPLEEVSIKEHKKILLILPSESNNRTKKIDLEGIIDIADDCLDSDLSINHDKYLYGAVSD